MDWYFDFISPYSYLQCERMPQWPEGTSIVPKPILFAALLNHWGQKGPAEIPVKRVFTYRQVQWLAERDGIAFRFPPRHPFNPINALRLAIAAGNEMEAIRTIFRFIWRDGGEFESAEGWKALCRQLRVEDGEALVARQEVKDELRANGEQALAAGVFGVPTILVDGRIFWGYDATPMAHEYLVSPARFDSEEMQRVAALPVGKARVPS